MEIDDKVDNGIIKVVSEDKMFKNPISVKECILNIKTRKQKV